MKVLLNRSFYLNGHTLGFHPQTRKVHLLTQGLTLGVKGLITYSRTPIKRPPIKRLTPIKRPAK